MRELLDRVSWPARRWLADRLIGNHAYSRNTANAFWDNLRTVNETSLTAESFEAGMDAIRRAKPYWSTQPPFRTDRNPSETA